MSVYEGAKEKRIDSIIASTAGSPKSCRDLEKELGHNYYTLLRDIKELTALGRLQPVGVREKSVIYTSNLSALSGWPTLFKDAGHQDVTNLKDFINLTRRDNFVSGGVQTFYALNTKAFEIMALANDQRNGHAIEPLDRETFRKGLVELRKYLNIFESMFSNPKLWTKVGLKELAVIEDFPSSKKIEWAEQNQLAIANEEFVAMLQRVKERYDAAQASQAANDAGADNVRSEHRIDVPGSGEAGLEHAVRSGADQEGPTEQVQALNVPEGYVPQRINYTPTKET